jgi:hypothetical protein
LSLLAGSIPTVSTCPSFVRELLPTRPNQTQERMVERLQKVTAADLTENSVLLGDAERITETLKKVEAAGFSEVILYFNVGMKPHAQVKEEMDRFMRDVAPHFEGKHRERCAA